MKSTQKSSNRIIIIRKDSSSKYRGVSRHKSKKRWPDRINVNSEHKLIGYSKDEIQAAKAYNKAAKKYRREFAVLNIQE